MPVTKDKSAPYAPPSAVLEVVSRHRSRGMPSPIDTEVLGRAGISDSLIPRTLQALVALDLINEDGSHTDTLEGLRLAPESDYKDRLGEWLNAAFADVLEFVDPAIDDETKIRDAFRPFSPTGQQPRMVTLFVGLYAAAGIGPEKSTPTPRRATPRAKPAERKTPLSGVRRGQTGGDQLPSGIPAPIAGLLSSLPSEGEGWTIDRREKFLVTFSAVIDFCFPIVESEVAEHAETQQEDES